MCRTVLLLAALFAMGASAQTSSAPSTNLHSNTTLYLVPAADDIAAMTAAATKVKAKIALDVIFKPSVSRLRALINDIDDSEFVAFAYAMQETYKPTFTAVNKGKTHDTVSVKGSLQDMSTKYRYAVATSRRLVATNKDGRRKLGAFGVAVGAFEAAFVLAAPEVAALGAFVFVVYELKKSYDQYGTPQGDFTKSGSAMKGWINSYMDTVDYPKDSYPTFTFREKDTTDVPKQLLIRLPSSISQAEFKDYLSCFRTQALVHAAEGNRYDFEYNYNHKRLTTLYGLTGLINKRLMQSVRAYCGKVARHPNVRVYDFTDIKKNIHAVDQQENPSLRFGKSNWGPAFVSNVLFRQGHLPYQSNKFPLLYDPHHAGQDVIVYTDDAGFVVDHPEYKGRVTVIDHKRERCNRTPNDMVHGTATLSNAIGKTTGLAFGATARVCCSRDPAESIDCINAMAMDMLNFPGKKIVFYASYDITGWKPEALALFQDTYANLGYGGANALLASGKNIRNSDNCKLIPQVFPGFMVTGAINIDGNIADYTSRGRCTDFWSPGVTIAAASVRTRGLYGQIHEFMDGNSMGTALAAGAMANYLSSVPKNKYVSPHFVKVRMMATAQRTIVDKGGEGIKKPVVQAMYYHERDILDSSGETQMHDQVTREELLRVVNKYRVKYGLSQLA